MSKDKSKVTDKTQEAPQEQEQMKLDDARRVKVLSPGMLVFKRFIRNKLAVAGIIILAIMFTFSFIGPLFSPYKRAQIFTKDVQEPGDYATGKFNEESRFFGKSSTSIQSAALKALGNNKVNGKYSLTAGQEIPFTASKEQYTLKVINPDDTKPSCVILGTKHIATVSEGEIKFSDPEVVDAAFEAALLENAASGSKDTEFDYNGTKVMVNITKVERKYFVTDDNPVAVSTYNIYTALRGKVADLQGDPDFLHAVGMAVNAGETTVNYDGKNYTLTGDVENGFLLAMEDGTGLFNITRDFRVGTINVDVQEEGKEPTTKEVDVENAVIGKGMRDIHSAETVRYMMAHLGYDLGQSYSLSTILSGFGSAVMKNANYASTAKALEKQFNKLTGKIVEAIEEALEKQAEYMG